MKHIKFVSSPGENAFFEEVKLKVHNYFLENKKNSYSDLEMLLKAFFWIITFLLTYMCILIFKNPILIVSFGILHMFTHVMIAFNITHDANHNAMFKSSKLNILFGYLIELLGCNRKLWIMAHNQEHHSFINILRHDNNVDGYKLLRLSPEDKLYKYHKYQYIYAPIVYGLSTLNYATFRDIKMIYKYYNISSSNLTLSFIIEFVLFKTLYYTYIFVIPIIYFEINYKFVLIYFFIGHFFNGIFLALIFVTGHLTEETSYPEVEENTVKNNWAIHVIKTTGDYATNSQFMQWLVGGINLHVAHHLFPKICHVHYKSISPLIKSTALKYGFSYREIPTFRKALASHFNLLKTLGQI